MANKQNTPTPRTKMAELNTSLFLTFILIPLLTIGGIAAYGFVVWFLQILNGPPGS
ncbi:MAG: periplasmic nitrate reductase, NapE protein [Marinomonas sp.]|jgi:nitrate reductase NapE|uniref:periplasmic nitrate reductase, NapE protein n=1 Tax=unclassified Marinomonas TaxID=196814 RepID=UPI0009EDFFA1|nr:MULTISPECIES: periplasmic nitrate reductase, NapE protein [unclassified Marinomonas]